MLRIYASISSFCYSIGSVRQAVNSYDQAIEDLEQQDQAKNGSLLVLGGSANHSAQAVAALRPEWFDASFRFAAIAGSS